MSISRTQAKSNRENGVFDLATDDCGFDCPFIRARIERERDRDHAMTEADEARHVREMLTDGAWSVPVPDACPDCHVGFGACICNSCTKAGGA